MTSKNNTPTSGSETNRYAAERPSVSRTLIADFGWMIPDLPDHAWRVYCCVRSFIFDKDPEAVSVQLTDEEIGRLIGRSESAVKRGRRECYKHGLLYEHSRRTEHHYPERGSHWVRTIRTLGVTLDPPNEWSGPTNCYARLREIRAEIQAERTAKPDRSDVTTQGDQEDSGGPNVSPGQPEGSNSIDSGSDVTDSGSDVTDSGSDVTDPPGGTQHGIDLHLSPHVSFHLSHQQQAEDVGGGEGELPTDKNQDDPSPGEGDLAGAEAGDDVEARARRLIVSLRPTSDPASRVQPHRGVVQDVARALRADVPEAVIREYLVEGAETARQPAAIVVTRARSIDDLITAREEAAQRKAQREGQDQDEPSPGSGIPEWCGECDEVDRVRDEWRWQEGIRGRPGNWVRKPVLCDCHPNKRRRRESAPA